MANTKEKKPAPEKEEDPEKLAKVQEQAELDGIMKNCKMMSNKEVIN